MYPIIPPQWAWTFQIWEKKSISEFTKSMVGTGLQSTGVLVNVGAHSPLECVHICICTYRICRKDPSSWLTQGDLESLHYEHTIMGISIVILLFINDALTMASLHNKQLKKKKSVSVILQCRREGWLEFWGWEQCAYMVEVLLQPPLPPAWFTVSVILVISMWFILNTVQYSITWKIKMLSTFVALIILIECWGKNLMG